MHWDFHKSVTKENNKIINDFYRHKLIRVTKDNKIDLKINKKMRMTRKKKKRKTNGVFKVLF
jgi:hypothetical protein